MAITDVSVPYPDFKLLDVIEPDQFDLNNSTLVEKINVMLAVLNQITDGVTDGTSGADAVSLTTIDVFTSTKLQSLLEEVITRLKATTDNASGADYIGATAIPELSGTTVQAQLESLKEFFTHYRKTVDEDALLAQKTPLTGDHKGTWNGFTLNQAGAGLNGGRLDVLEQQTIPKMKNESEVLIWMGV